MSWIDRVVLAFAGVVFGALTLLGYVVVVVFVGPRTAPAVAELFLSPLGLAYIVVCGCVGAFTDPKRLAHFFGLLWGTDGFWETRRGKYVSAAIAIALLVALLVLRAGARDGL